MPNPYTLINGIPGDSEWYSVLDLKDTLFCLLVDLASQTLFAFEWQDPEILVKTQYCWTVLPQGFKNSPTIFRETLSKDLEELQFQRGVLLQYVNDLLITGPTYEDCLKNTSDTLNHLGN